MSVVPARLRPCWPRTALRGFFGPSTPPPEFPVKSVFNNKPAVGRWPGGRFGSVSISAAVRAA
jgi:hypothetical protein